MELNNALPDGVNAADNRPPTDKTGLTDPSEDPPTEELSIEDSTGESEVGESDAGELELAPQVVLPRWVLDDGVPEPHDAGSIEPEVEVEPGIEPEAEVEPETVAMDVVEPEPAGVEPDAEPECTEPEGTELEGVEPEVVPPAPTVRSLPVPIPWRSQVGVSTQLMPVIGTDPIADALRRSGEVLAPKPPGRSVRWRVAAGLAVAVVLALITAAITSSGPSDPSGKKAADGQSEAASSGVSQSESSTQPGGVGGGASAVSDSTFTIAATGDIVLGNAPGTLPQNGGRDFFQQAQGLLGADLQMGNLEQTLTDDTGTAKCSAASAGKTCFSFRTPPAYAQVLRSAGFGLMNMANNHAYDYGQKGYENTKSALDAAGLKYTGAPGVVTVVPVNGVRVAVVGFAPYPWSNDPNDLDGARKLVAEASSKADVVIVQAHMGAEGSDRTHVALGTETYLGENRGDPIRFAHAVIDAGADLVIGHGPHVLRGMEFYRGRLVAYSLGNFAGYGALGTAGVVGVGGVLRVRLRGDGTYVEGALASSVMVSPGLPAADQGKQAVKLVSGLSTHDFGPTAAKIDNAGGITQP